MRRAAIIGSMLGGVAVLLSGCNRPAQPAGKETVVAVKDSEFPERVYWGDTHLHTDNSIDAFGFGVRLGPERGAALRARRGSHRDHRDAGASSTGRSISSSSPITRTGSARPRRLYDAPRLLIRDETLRRWHDMMHEGPQASQRAMAELITARPQRAARGAARSREPGARRPRRSGRAPRDGRPVQRAGQVHRVRRLRIHADARRQQPAPRGHLPRRQRQDRHGAARIPGLGGHGRRAVGLHGRLREDDRRPGAGDPAQFATCRTG